MGKIQIFVSLMIFSSFFSIMASPALGETMFCYIKNPSGTNVATGSAVIAECAALYDLTCSATCDTSTTPACCNVEGQYTWQVYDDPPSFTCIETVDAPPASQTGSAYTVNWDTQTYCTQTCAGSGVGKAVDWNLPSKPDQCCGILAGESVRECEDDGGGYCTPDDKACCTGGTGAECVKDGVCYALCSQSGGWQCQASNAWRLVPPVVPTAQLQCSLRSASCNAGETDMLHLSAQYNAHAELPGQSGFPSPYKICCSGPIAVGAACSGSYANFLDLYSPSNSHVEKQSGSGGYLNDACISSSAIRCEYAADCSTINPVSGGSAACLASISGDTNAHIGDCCAYSTKVCCWLDDTISPAVDIGYSPSVFSGVDTTEADRVTFTATATDNSGGTGLKSINIYVDGAVKATCTSSPCTWTNTLSFYSPGQTVSFYATAEDNLGNPSQSATKSFTVCSFNSVSIAPAAECSPTDGCEQGQYVSVSATYSGNTCPATKVIQVDALSSDGTCDIERVLGPGVDISGVNVICITGGSCSGSWAVPAIPADCQGKTVSGTGASLRDDQPPPAWKAFGYFFNSSTNIGSFKLSAQAPELLQVTASPDYVRQGTAITVASVATTAVGQIRLRCGSAPDTERDGYADDGPLCNGPAAASNPSCTFNSPWANDGIKTIYCRTYNTNTLLYSTSERSDDVISDNTPPLAGVTGAPASWSNAIATATVSCSDAGSMPSGCDSGTYRLRKYASNPGVCSSDYSTYNLLSPQAISDHSWLCGAAKDNTGNTGFSSPVEFKVDRVNPTAQLTPLPLWTNKDFINIEWTGVDTGGAGLKNFRIGYKIMNAGLLVNDWTLLIEPVSAGNMNYAPVQENYTYYFRVRATDNANNIGNWDEESTTIDRVKPACTMNPLPAFSPGTFQISWSGNDFGQSGVASYDIQVNPNSAGWVNAIGVGAGKCVLGAGSTATCTGINGVNYKFHCMATDNAGNLGDWSGDVSTMADTTPPATTRLTPNPLNRWINSTSSPPPITVKLEWSSLDDLSGVDCFYAKWRKCSSPITADSANNGACSSWGNWYYVKDAASGISSNCLPASGCVSGVCRGQVIFNGVGINDAGGEVPGSISNLDIYEFNAWAKDLVGNVETQAASKAIIDAISPTFDYDVFDSYGVSIKGKAVVKASETTSIRVTTTATDTASGIEHNYINYCITQAGTYTCNTYDAPDVPAAEWGGASNGALNLPYDESTAIKYTIKIKDRAGNWVFSQPMFIVTHGLANFVVHMLILPLGEPFDLQFQVRNIESATQEITISLDGYEFAAFQPAEGLTILGAPCNPGRCAKLTMAPGEERLLYMRLLANEITETPKTLNLNAVSALGSSDSDSFTIMVGYPADFPAFDAWWAILLMMMLAGVVFYRTELSA